MYAGLTQEARREAIKDPAATGALTVRRLQPKLDAMLALRPETREIVNHRRRIGDRPALVPAGGGGALALQEGRFADGHTWPSASPLTPPPVLDWKLRTLRDIEKTIRLSRAMMSDIRQNRFLAFIYNAVGIPIAAGALYSIFGWLLSSMMIAGAAMSLSSVSVIANALRLRWVGLEG